jgi:hypothetical protein
MEDENIINLCLLLTQSTPVGFVHLFKFVTPTRDRSERRQEEWLKKKRGKEKFPRQQVLFFLKNDANEISHSFFFK